MQCMAHAIDNFYIVQVCKSFFSELDRHLNEVLAPRMDELGAKRYAAKWPQPPRHFSLDLQSVAEEPAPRTGSGAPFLMMSHSM